MNNNMKSIEYIQLIYILLLQMKMTVLSHFFEGHLLVRVKKNRKLFVWHDIFLF